MSKYIQLTIFDDDGHEGTFSRLYFDRSWQAVSYLFGHPYYSTHIEDYNFEIVEKSGEI